MFRRKFKNNLKNKLICDNKIINNIFNLIIIIINFDNKLYKKVIKKIRLTLEISTYILLHAKRSL